MITLYQAPAVWGLPNMSPFCAKLETYLRMANLPYTIAPGNPMIAPKGKIPYADIDGKIMGDSSFIIEHLKKKHGDSLDNNLTAEQKAHALCVQRLVEEHLYFAGAWLRWNTDNSWSHVKQVIGPMLPPILRPLILKKIRKDFLKDLHGQGMGRHSREEIIQFAKEDLKAISDLLGNKLYFFGNEATSIDATLYGFLVQMIWVPWEGPLKEYALSLPNIVSYCENMKKQYWH